MGGFNPNGGFWSQLGNGVANFEAQRNPMFGSVWNQYKSSRAPQPAPGQPQPYQPIGPTPMQLGSQTGQAAASGSPVPPPVQSGAVQLPPISPGPVWTASVGARPSLPNMGNGGTQGGSSADDAGGSAAGDAGSGMGDAAETGADMAADAAIVGFKQGAIVTKPTIARIGEKGPEAVIPLTPRAGNKMQPDIMEGHISAPRVPGIKYSRYRSFNRLGGGQGGEL